MTEENFNKNVCRLCGRTNGIRVNIFDSIPENECIAKIEAVVPDVVILRNDSLPKLVCHRCVAKVKEFYEFKETCIQTQLILKDRLPWMSTNTKSTIQRVVSPVVTYMGGPLAYPYGQPEPDVEVLILSDDEDNSKTSAESSLLNATPLSSYTKSHQANESFGLNELSPICGPVHSFQNGKVMSAGALKNSAVHSVNMDSTGVHHPSHPSNQNTGSSQAASTSALAVQKSVAVPGSSLIPLASHPRSVAQFHQSLSVNQSAQFHQSLSVNQSAKQQFSYASSETLSALRPASKRLCLQATGHGQTDLSERNSLNFLNKRPSSGTSIVATAGSSSMSENYVPPPIPPSISIRSPKTLQKLNSTVHTLSSKVGPPATHKLSVGSDVPQTANNSVFDKTVKVGKTHKPKPKSKKKPVKLTEEDTHRICQLYPRMNSFKISESTLIFTCTMCNKILMNEEAVTNHECVTALNSEGMNGQSSIDISTSDQIYNQNENSNNSVCSYVELSSDDESSNFNLAPKHSCNICGKEFHNLARLQKHEVSHSISEAS